MPDKTDGTGVVVLKNSSRLKRCATAAQDHGNDHQSLGPKFLSVEQMITSLPTLRKSSNRLLKAKTSVGFSPFLKKNTNKNKLLNKTDVVAFYLLTN